MHPEVDDPMTQRNEAARPPGLEASRCLGIFRAALRCVTDILNSVERTREPLHPAFDVVYEGWYWNNLKQPTTDPTHKVCFYFNESDLPLLSNCPYSAKFAENRNEALAFKFCGFAYPRNSTEIALLSDWAARFPQAELYTYGQHLEGGGWKPGELVRLITCDKD